MWSPLLLVLWATAVQSTPWHQGEDGSTQIPFFNDESETMAEPTLPIIDLGYTKHQAVPSKNKDLYKFQSIRYAAPPIGDLRFRAPQPPLHNPSGVEDGHGRKECLQATVNWAENFPDEEECENCECCKKENEDGSCAKPCPGRRPKKPSFKKLIGGLLPKVNLTDPDKFSEDCLFLDVWTPKSALENQAKLPVFVWIYGGAYVFGGKTLYLPGGLMDRAMIHDRGGMVFVSMNYRMGALGFAAGQDIPDEDVNAGLLDQEQALKWVKEHIEKFGGDPDQVTIAGLSAGGGSVLHQITAYGGKQPALFQRAISFSGGWQPVTNRTEADATFKNFMEKYNDVSSIEELRKVSEEQMMQANFKHVFDSPPGTFTYNPTAWGDFAPNSPSKLFQEGSFHKDVDVMLSHTFNEGGQFTTAFEDKETSVSRFVDFALPDVSQKEREWIIETYDSNEDTDAADIARIIGDVTFRCHVTYVSDAKNRQVWRQRWNTVGSNGHGGDMLPLFYQPLLPVKSVRSARILQDYSVTFAINGAPTTNIRNPPFSRNPAPYRRHDEDDKVQFFDSDLLRFPKLWRGDTELENICREWQKMHST